MCPDTSDLSAKPENWVVFIFTSPDLEREIPGTLTWKWSTFHGLSNDGTPIAGWRISWRIHDKHVAGVAGTDPVMGFLLSPMEYQTFVQSNGLSNMEVYLKRSQSRQSMIKKTVHFGKHIIFSHIQSLSHIHRFDWWNKDVQSQKTSCVENFYLVDDYIWLQLITYDYIH